MADIPGLNFQLSLEATTSRGVLSNDKNHNQESFSKTLEQISSRKAEQGYSINNSGIKPNFQNNTPSSIHFPTNNSVRGGRSEFQENMLNIRAYRQQLIASNIANSDTPGYKAQNIEIDESIGVMNREPMILAKSNSSHMSGVALGKVNAFNLKYRTPYQSSADGNTVEMDIERQHFAENAVMYQFTLDRVGGEFKDMAELLRNLK